MPENVHGGLCAIIHHIKFCSLIFSQTLNKLFIINAGSGFRMLWKVIKTFLDPRTMSKIQVRTFLVNSFLGRGSLLLLVSFSRLQCLLLLCGVSGAWI